MKIYNPNLKKDIVDELKYLDSQYFQVDLPVPFKEGLTLYPVNLRQHDEFLACTDCFTLNRLDTTEGIMSKSNLDYLIFKMTQKNDEGIRFSRYFGRMCELIFHIKDGIRCRDCGEIIDYQTFIDKVTKEGENFVCAKCGSKNFGGVIEYRQNEETKQNEFWVNGVSIDRSEFDRLRQIVMYQNLPDYKDDSWVDPEVREDQKEKQEILAKKNKAGSATLERKVVCISAKTGYKISELYELSIRKFLILLSAVDDLITYETSRIGMMSGMVTMKEPLEHWIYKNESDDLYGAATDAGQFKDMVSGKGPK